MTLEQKIKEIEKKSAIFDNLTKASKHYGLNFCYNATMESGILNNFKNVENIEEIQSKSLNLLDLVAEQALTLNQALEVIRELQKETAEQQKQLDRVRDVEKLKQGIINAQNLYINASGRADYLQNYILGGENGR